MRRSGRAGITFLVGLLGVIVGAFLVLLLTRSVVSAPKRETGTTAPQAGPSPAVSAESQDAITAAVAKVGPAVVNINTISAPPARSPLEEQLRQFMDIPTEPFPQRGQGSGIIIDARRGHVLTNTHVARGADKIEVLLADGRRFPAKTIGLDPLTDIALLQIPGGDLPAAAMASGSELPIGAWVIAIGNPFGFENSVTVGVLSAKDRYVRDPASGRVLTDMLQTDASINPGNSGGALVDLKGNVVGIPTAIIPFAQGIGFAVPADVAKQIVERLISTGKAPYLGVSHRAATPEDVARLRVPDGKGTLVAMVEPNGPAAAAGVKPGDVILQVGESRIGTAKDLGSAVRSHDVGTRVPITVWRDGRKVNLDVTLGAVPEQGIR